MRVTNAVASRKRRKRMIEAAKGFRLRRSKLYRYAKDAIEQERITHTETKDAAQEREGSVRP